MNLFIDSFHQRICFFSGPLKKEAPLFFEMAFPYPLLTPENQLKALTEFLTKEETRPLFESKRVDLLLPDSGIGFGAFELPALSKGKALDAFNTRFKVSYPNFEAFYVTQEEYERSKNGCLYFYTFVKKVRIDQVTAMLKTRNIAVGSVNFFAGHLARISDPKNIYPKATLIVGEDNAELIITKGHTALFVYDFGYGARSILNGEQFFDSSYHPAHDRSSQYAGFAEKNFASKIPFTDENIAKTDPKAGFSVSRPKELRIMKDEILANYVIKNNFRKVYALIGDILARYASAPWFLPLTEIDTYAPGEIVSGLTDIGESENLVFKSCDGDAWQAIYKHTISNHRLFGSAIKKERRKFDWREFLTMEIGKKKA